jgi:hypothetical protein
VAQDARDRWKKGTLPIFRRAVRYRKVKTQEVGGLKRDVRVPELVTESAGTDHAVAYGHRLALLVDEKTKRLSEQLESGLWVDVEVLDGRPQCVGLRGDPEVTPKMLRFPLDKALAYLIRTHTLRLELDEAGGVIGYFATSPESPVEHRTVAERTADLQERYARSVRRGRRPLSEEHLREVLNVAKNATDAKEPASRAIAEKWNVTPGTARQWLYRARKALGKEENDA